MQKITRQAGEEAGLVSLGVILITIGVSLIQQEMYLLGIILVVLGIAVIMVKELLLKRELAHLGIYVGEDE